MGCGCGKKKANAEDKPNDVKPNEAKPAEIVKPVEKEEVLIDESVISKLNNNANVNQSNQHVNCHFSVNDYATDLVTFKLFDNAGNLLHEASVLKYEPCETFVKIIHDYENKSNFVFSNKDGLASQISSHTYVHKEVKNAINDYSQQKIDVKTFQDTIKKITEITFKSNNKLRMEFFKVKKLLNNK